MKHFIVSRSKTIIQKIRFEVIINPRFNEKQVNSDKLN